MEGQSQGGGGEVVAMMAQRFKGNFEIMRARRKQDSVKASALKKKKNRFTIISFFGAGKNLVPEGQGGREGKLVGGVRGGGLGGGECKIWDLKEKERGGLRMLVSGGGRRGGVGLGTRKRPSNSTNGGKSGLNVRSEWEGKGGGLEI